MPKEHDYLLNAALALDETLIKELQKPLYMAANETPQSAVAIPVCQDATEHRSVSR